MSFKRVLLVYDVPGWAWEYRAAALKKYAPPNFEVTCIPQSALNSDMVNQYQGVLVFSWPDSPVVDKRVWTFVANEGCMYPWNPSAESAHQRTASRYKNVETACERIPKFRGVITINHRTINFLKELNPRTHYLQTGVDCDFWRPILPINSCGPMRVGWSGKAFDDPTKWTSKGYHEILVPLMEHLHESHRTQHWPKDPIEFVVNRAVAGNALNSLQMRDWYNSIDLLLITSCSEGTPSTMLEAMACGRPFVSTSVGIADLAAARLNRYASGAHNLFVTQRWVDAETQEGCRESLSALISQFWHERTALCELSSAARMVAVNYFNWKELAEQWLNLITT